MDGFSAFLDKMKKKYLSKKNLKKTVKEKTDSEQLMCDTFNQREGDLNKTDGYNCPECKNRGCFLEVNERGFVVNKPCKCMSMRKMILKLEKSGLPNFREMTFKDFWTVKPWQKKIKLKAMLFAHDSIHDHKKSWFFIGGQPGCGKTHLCTAITKILAFKGENIHYMLWRDEVTRIKSVITDYERYEKMMSVLKKVDVLYIDDLFKTPSPLAKQKIVYIDSCRPSAADINIAFEILNARYNNKKLITIISSEKDIKEIADMDEAIAGRIIERCEVEKNIVNIPKNKKMDFRLYRGELK